MSNAEEAISDRSNWPEGVERISLDNLARLGVDRASQLCWDGKVVEIQRRLKLSRLQVAGAFAGGHHWRFRNRPQRRLRRRLQAGLVGARLREKLTAGKEPIGG